MGRVRVLCFSFVLGGILAGGCRFFCAQMLKLKIFLENSCVTKKLAYLYTMTNAQNNTTMKLIKKNDRLTQLKKGRKVVFEILQSRKSKFTSFQHGLAIVTDCETLEQCLQATEKRLQFLNAEFKNRLV